MDKENLINLTGLWKKYGAQKMQTSLSSNVFVNPKWPYRYWLDAPLDNIAYQSMSSRFDNIPEQVTIPVWPMMKSANALHYETAQTQFKQTELLSDNWHCGFEQLAMYKQLPIDVISLPQNRSGFVVTQVATAEELAKWVLIGSEAFAYQIDSDVIKQLVDDKELQILLGWQHGEAVASALLYKTGEVIGVHQVAVKQAFQGQGIANAFMQHIIAICSQWQGKYMVLQASVAGQPLYAKLGFKAQFKIKNFQFVQTKLIDS